MTNDLIENKIFLVYYSGVQMTQLKRIIITDKKHSLPFSKGLLAKSLTAAGISPKQAYHIAELVEDHLRKNDKLIVKSKFLKKIILQKLTANAGEDKTEKYKNWQALGALDKPLIILVGGATGVGKSTIASEIAHRLGINRLTSTDSIREVMRVIFSTDIAPALQESSFHASRAIRAPVDEKTDPVIAGFMEQTAVVSVGIEAIIQRAINENLHMVIEGIHIVPGFLDLELFKGAFVVPLIIKVDDEKVHKSHFYMRGVQTHQQRPFEKYVKNFDAIRKIGFYIEDLAKKNKVSIIHSYGLDNTIPYVIEDIYRQIKNVTSSNGSKKEKTKKSKKIRRKASG